MSIFTVRETTAEVLPAASVARPEISVVPWPVTGTSTNRACGVVDQVAVHPTAVEIAVR